MVLEAPKLFVERVEGMGWPLPEALGLADSGGDPLTRPAPAGDSAGCGPPSPQVMVNTFQNDALAPFGGYKQSSFGREFGLLGLESFPEPKAIIGN